MGYCIIRITERGGVRKCMKGESKRKDIEKEGDEKKGREERTF